LPLEANEHGYGAGRGDTVKQAQADRTKGRTGLTSAEREELTRLRRENRILQEERDILTKAAAFFAKHQR
jgi:transposase